MVVVSIVLKRTDHKRCQSAVIYATTHISCQFICHLPNICLFLPTDGFGFRLFRLLFYHHILGNERKPVPANAILKNKTVSTMDASVEDGNGAFH